MSSVGPFGGVTISGPPETLSLLFEETSLKDSRPLEGETYGAYSAPHLYGTPALRQVLASEDEQTTSALKDAKIRIPILSSSSGSEFSTASYGSLLQQAVADILARKANLDLVVQECASLIQNNKCRVVPIGPSFDSDAVVSKLQQNGVGNISLFETALGSVQRRGTGNYKSSKIAIVGMSGRFPGGQDIHEFWEMLQKGLDMHKEVSCTLHSICSDFSHVTRCLRIDSMHRRITTLRARDAT